MAKSEQSYLTWQDGDNVGRAHAMSNVSEALQKIQPLVRSVATNIYMDSAPHNVSVRDGYGRRDYEQFRPGEAIPKKPKDLIAACDSACDNNGIVNNVINLMADFTSKGIDLVHPNERIEKFYREWARKVGLRRVSERFAHYLYRHGTVIAKRQMAKLKPQDEDRLKRAQAQPADIEIDPPLSPKAKEVPWRYTFLHPCSVELISESLAPFVGPEGFVYAVKVPKDIVSKVINPKTLGDKFVRDKLPADIRHAIESGETYLPLDPKKVSVSWYKRDDWRAWARPLIAPILKDLNMLEKMKLADLAALDGAISCIRVWKLGSLEHKLMPPPATIIRLAEMLTNNVGGGVMDLVWGPDLELIETSTEVHRFLGSTKYGHVLQLIYSGLGIPQTLTGSEQATGFTNNYMSLKTLTERLEYGRTILKEFWEQEVILVQKAMNFRFPAKITFDNMLNDEVTQQKMLLDMSDRDLIDAETLQEEMGFDPDIIAVRQRRDMRRRKGGKLPAKASPFHNSANHKGDMEKLFAQTGVYTPEEFGVELGDRKAGSKPPAEQTAKLKQKTDKKKLAQKGQPGQGRPLSKKDETKRKQRKPKPRTKAFLQDLATAEEMLGQIAKAVTPVYLQAKHKKTLRELTDEEGRDFESFKFHLLNQFGLEKSLTDETIKAALSSPLAIPAAASALLKQTVASHTKKHGKEPGVETLRRYHASVFALCRGEASAV